MDEFFWVYNHWVARYELVLPSKFNLFILHIYYHLHLHSKYLSAVINKKCECKVDYNSVIHSHCSWFIFHLISHFIFLKNGIKNEQRNNMKNDPKNTISQTQLSCLFLMSFCFSSIFHVQVSSCQRVFWHCPFFFFFPDMAIASFYSLITLHNEQKN